MDNGLIFPYPRERVHDEAVDANYPKRGESSDELSGA
jgi:hypothetical protein